MSKQAADVVKPYIPASKSLPETTVKAIVLGIILAIFMAGSNAYLALKVGMSLSACIPAAVISMAILKFFKSSNILENNIVQTAASVGESLAAALAFTLPVLVMVGYWNEFPFLLTASITIIGGFLGVMLTVPLRRAMIVDGKLPFPEGVATAEVLKAGDSQGRQGAKYLIIGGIVASVAKFCESGFRILSDSISYWFYTGSTVIGFGGGMSLAITGAGFIIGIKAATAVFAGAILGWFIGVPLCGFLEGIPLDAKDPYTAAVTIWNNKIRIVGVGAMIVGGVWTIFELWGSLVRGVKSSVEASRRVRLEGKDSLLRTEKDIPITYVAAISTLMALPLYILLDYLFDTSSIDASHGHTMFTVFLLVAFSYVLSFLACATASYMTGLMGSSNNPLSGILILCLLTLSFVMFLLLGTYIDFNLDAQAAIDAGGIVIVMLAVLGCSASIAVDNLQDLKSGQLVGATPWKQQVTLLVGTVASALFLASILQLLFEAYGFGDVMPREGMDPAQSLAVPKAVLFSGLIQGIFTQTMDWTMIVLGCFLAVAIIIVDKMFQASGSECRFPVVAVAVGIYLPLEITTPIFIGGILSYLVNKVLKKKKLSKDKLQLEQRRGILFAAGLISGEALVGIMLAVPFVAYQSTDVFKIVPPWMEVYTEYMGVAVMMAVLVWFYRLALNGKNQ
jgi:putative OPT family oligopeptide transporter